MGRYWHHRAARSTKIISELARILHEGGRTMLLIYRHFNHLIKNQSLIVRLQFVRVVLSTIFCQEQNIAPKIQILHAIPGLEYAAMKHFTVILLLILLSASAHAGGVYQEPDAFIAEVFADKPPKAGWSGRIQS